jgi:hypothetical protein
MPVFTEMTGFTADFIFLFLSPTSWDLQFNTRKKTNENQASKTII